MAIRPLDCTIGYHAVIEDFVTIYPSVNVCGFVVEEKGIELGTGVQIIQGKRLSVILEKILVL